MYLRNKKQSTKKYITKLYDLTSDFVKFIVRKKIKRKLLQLYCKSYVNNFMFFTIYKNDFLKTLNYNGFVALITKLFLPLDILIYFLVGHIDFLISHMYVT